MESKAQAWTMRVLAAAAASACFSCIRSINSGSPHRSAYEVPSEMHAATTGSPKKRYGPVALMMTEAVVAMARRAVGSDTSATTTPVGGAPVDESLATSASSLGFDRPAMAQRSTVGGVVPEVAPVKPVAPKMTMSYRRPAIGEASSDACSRLERRS